MAICYVQVEKYPEAGNLFESACQAMLQPPQKRLDITFPERLVDACALSGKTSLYDKTLEWLNNFRLTKPQVQGYSPVACYSYAVMELLSGSVSNIAFYIQVLLKKPKYKDMLAIGHTLQAISDGNQGGFTTALTELLQVHERQVKFGGLRWAGVDFQTLCMYAMSLGLVANKYGLRADMESDYFSKGYLEFLASLKVM